MILLMLVEPILWQISNVVAWNSVFGPTKSKIWKERFETSIKTAGRLQNIAYLGFCENTLNCQGSIGKAKVKY